MPKAHHQELDPFSLDTATCVVITELLAGDEKAGSVLDAIPVVFPWTRHLSDSEMREFLQDLADAARDAVDQDVHGILYRIIIERRATPVSWPIPT